ncbi:hypothetical protein DPEC_G00121530 [Dallia pectoralis]|uniref:Uncharacterized protein n=1 Tax=Dallia pectoralis TaxID=75939 RepID=A0ACC2GPX4_DALPE|nr:hypothetical protein DPEC_G00121530 [Dallia pectoralis]
MRECPVVLGAAPAAGYPSGDKTRASNRAPFPFQGAAFDCGGGHCRGRGVSVWNRRLYHTPHLRSRGGEIEVDVVSAVSRVKLPFGPRVSGWAIRSSQCLCGHTMEAKMAAVLSSEEAPDSPEDTRVSGHLNLFR